MTSFLTIVGYITSLIVVGQIVVGLVMWTKGSLPALWRLGFGLAKRKIVIFANAENAESLKVLLTDSSLFNKKNITAVNTDKDVGRAESKTLFLVHWGDWKDNIESILNVKTDSTALIIYSPPDVEKIPLDKLQLLDKYRNVIVANFRGRLLNDVIASIISTSYEKK